MLGARGERLSATAERTERENLRSRLFFRLPAARNNFSAAGAADNHHHVRCCCCFAEEPLGFHPATDGARAHSAAYQPLQLIIFAWNVLDFE